MTGKDVLAVAAFVLLPLAVILFVNAMRGD